MHYDDMTAAQLRRLPAPGESTRLARSEGRRIAAERGVPLVDAGTPESRALTARYGLSCVLGSACPPFGTCPAGWYDYATLMAVLIPAEPSAEDLERWRTARDERIRVAEERERPCT